MLLHGAHIGPRPFLRDQSQALAKKRYRRIGVRRLSPVLGAELTGVDLRDVDDETFAEIQDAFLSFKVVFFRDQPLSIRDQMAFARRFGELEDHPFLPAKDGYGQVIRFEKGEDVAGVENQWHSDVSWREIPSLGSVLRAVEVPAVGGDTLFSDMTAAYKGLPEEVRKQIDGLRAVHDISQSFGRMLSAEQLEQSRKEFPPAEHPVVRTHPDTGEKILYVNRIFTDHIVGMAPEESRALIDQLCRQADYPEYQCRFHWEKDSVALWDNRAVQHYAANDYWPEKRVMERVTIIGDRPV
ncbi:MAG: TauD/TfdA dioxygenase family protein [Myxococcota bacterium]